MTEDKIIRMDKPDLNNMLERIERLEEIVAYHGEMSLYLVEEHDTTSIVAAPDFASCQSFFPKQGNIYYIGRASKEYNKFTVIKQLYQYNWDEREDYDR